MYYDIIYFIAWLLAAGGAIMIFLGIKDIIRDMKAFKHHRRVRKNNELQRKFYDHE